MHCSHRPRTAHSRTMAAQAGAAAGTLMTATTLPHAMNTYVALLNFTQQGLTNMHESAHRASAFRATARKSGCKVLHLFWTMGAHDGVIVFQAKDDAAATGLMMSLSALGNVHTSTMRAFDAAEFIALVEKAPKM